MAFEIVRVPEGSGRRFLQGYFADGQSVIFDDYSSGVPEVVSIVCHSDEDGGEIYIFPQEELHTDTPDTVHYMGRDPVVNKAGNIAPNTTYEHERVDQDGNRDLTIIKHMAPFATRSMN